MSPRRWRRRYFAAAVVVALGAAGLSEALAASGAPPSGPRLSESRIMAIALHAAVRAGDAHPLLIQHVESTRERANLVAGGDIIPDRQWSYLIAERGRFVLTDIGIGDDSLHGSALTLVVNARTGEVTDGGLSNRYPDMSKLGPVVTDQRIQGPRNPT
jgi:hypothetical protein